MLYLYIIICTKSNTKTVIFQIHIQWTNDKIKWIECFVWRQKFYKIETDDRQRLDKVLVCMCGSCAHTHTHTHTKTRFWSFSQKIVFSKSINIQSSNNVLSNDCNPPGLSSLPPPFKPPPTALPVEFALEVRLTIFNYWWQPHTRTHMYIYTCLFQIHFVIACRTHMYVYVFFLLYRFVDFTHFI